VDAADQIDQDLAVPAVPVVLLVDDDRVTRRILARAAEEAGYRAVLAEDGRRALELLRRLPVGAIVADHYMPGMSGLQLCTVARLGWPRIPRILVTGHADQDLAIRAINRGQVRRFLTKPVPPKMLAEALWDAVPLPAQHGRLWG